MAKTVTFYWATYCAGCHELEPIVKEVAERRGMKFETVDVEKCETERCRTMPWVPTVFIGNRELSVEELEAFINEQ